MDKKEIRRNQILNAPILPLLIKTAIPTIIGMLVTMIYNLTDTYFIGKLSNVSMTASIGIVFSFVSFIQAIGFWFGYGSGNRMSISLGNKDEDKARILSSTAILLSILTGFIIMVICLPFTETLARLLGASASESLLRYTKEYLFPILLSVPFSIYGVTLYNQLRLCGNVRDGMIGLLIGMIANMILDPLFIFTFKMGFIGAGWATLIGQILGSIALTILSFYHGNIPASLKHFKLKKEYIYHILAGGSPNFSRQSITSFAVILLNIIASKYGEDIIAALSISSKIASLVYMIMIGLGQGFQPICAMNYGAKKYDRVKKALNYTITIGTVFLIIAAVITGIYAKYFLGLLSNNEIVINNGIIMLRLQCIVFPLMAFYSVSSMYLQNTGNYMKALLVSISRQGIFFIPLIIILPFFIGHTAIYVVQSVSDILSFIMALLIMKKHPVQDYA